MSKQSGEVLDAVRTLYPGYFALVMATGIVSTAMVQSDQPTLSVVLLVIAIVCGLVLLAAVTARAARFTGALRTDLQAPGSAFAFFTFVAACNVIGARFALDGHHIVPSALLVLSGLVWLPLSYGVPAALILGPREQPVLAGVNGTWFVWVVGTQSMAVSLGLLEHNVHGAWARTTSLGAVLMWSVGVMLYLMVATLVLMRLLLLEVTAADLDPPYWIAMGATAITVLAASVVLQMDDVPVTTAVQPVVQGLAVVLWAFGTWLVPLLVLFSVWRYSLPDAPRGYAPTMWSIVFPLGMYAVASVDLGTQLSLPIVEKIGRAMAWVALVAWVVVFLAMLAAPLRSHLLAGRTQAH